MNKKVLFVIRELAGGGAERALSNILTNFPDDWEIDLLMNNRDFIEFPYKGRILSLEIPEPRSRKLVSHQIEVIIKRIRYLKKIKKTNHYDACISFLDSSNIANVLSGKKHCKTIVSIRSNMTSKKAGLLFRISAFPLINFIYRHADKIVTVSKEIELDIKKRYRIPARQIVTIVNGYDVNQIMEHARKQPKNARLPKGKKLVVTVGRLDSPKGQWHLIRAFTKVVEKEPNVVLYIIGTGECEQYLRRQIHLCHMEKNVYLMGYQSNPFWYNAQADVFVLPSMYEGFPNSLAEAICCGTPCIATDFHSGAREIMAPDMNVMGKLISDVTEVQYGILSPLCSGIMYKGTEPLELAELKLAEAILLLLKDQEKNQYYRKQSMIRSDTLGIEAIVQNWIQVITEN